MYRFRSTKYLLEEGYEELENQEIYFAPEEELNDPMDGIKDIVWQGDEVLWKNFMIHYLMCLEHVINIWSVLGQQKEINKDFIPVFKGKDNFSSVKYKERFNKIKEDFFSNEIMSVFPKLLAGKKEPIRFNELLMYLEFIHKFAFNSINLIDSSYGYTERINIFEKYIKDNKDIRQLENIFKGDNDKSSIDEDQKDASSDDKFEYTLEDLFNKDKMFSNESKSLKFYADRSDDNSNSNLIFIMIEFSKAYLSKIEELIFPKWYAACFTKECSNTYMWGNYGDHHKGVCLKFKTEQRNGREYIKLNGLMGYGSSSVIGESSYKFTKVNYNCKLTQIDFFKNLKSLTFPKFNKAWYTSDDGQVSSYAENMDLKQEWLDSYNEKFLNSVANKSSDLNFENEYRVIIDESLNEYSSEDERKLTYDFNDLEGIIFGIKTSNKDKAEIINIISRKCSASNRKDFQFYQAKYCQESGRIEAVKIDL